MHYSKNGVILKEEKINRRCKLRTAEEFKEYIAKLPKEKVEKIINAISWLISIQHADQILFRAIIGGEIFSRETLQPLAELVGWTESDNQFAKEMIDKFQKEIERKTPKEKRSALKEVLKIIGTAALSGTAGFVAGRLIKKEKNNEEKKKEPTS